MTRPILWALGTLVTAAVSATLGGERLADRFGLGGAPAASAPLSSAQPRSGPSPASPVLTVGSDLAGHFVLHPSLDGRRVRMMVDTGASLVALTHEDAALAGIRLQPRDFTRRVHTANGVAELAPVRIREVRVGDIVVRDVEALVSQPGRLGVSLLGMSFLRRLKGFEIAAGRLTLKG